VALITSARDLEFQDAALIQALVLLKTIVTEEEVVQFQAEALALTAPI
jgi:hypothetical protein